MPVDPWELLRQAREYICGCTMQDTVDPCECPTCEQATKLLVEVDAALDLPSDRRAD